ncbi:MAG: cation-transporting P-type ATPase [Pseudonocardia sp.]|uniref:cation-translocating P-type ATPase n=1 Tax=Pseudonocardia sp. TaxID=60912 RepID=UPI001AC4DA1D|nr:cation-transporting P-type ATPase [Pseudonocardia sp.]MBN9101044.1 cation-transporting P-type ATPase [Pseudonocardia sp.]
MTPAPVAAAAVLPHPWAAASAAVAAAVDTDPARGLDDADAAARLASTGPNEVPREPPRSLLHSVLAQLRETMILVLLGAAVLTAATGDLADCVVILLVVAVNTVVGVVQERRAVGAVAALTSLAAPRCTVLRRGTARRVDTRDLVPGDVLSVAEGDVAGADARLVTAHDLQVDEAMLTGESLPSARDPDALCAVEAPVGDRLTMLHAGTLVVHGTGTAVVVRTGTASELGRIARLLHEHAAPDTPLQRRLAALGRRLSLVAVAGCAAVVLLGLLRGQPWELMVVAGISLAVAAIPESLPAVVALALAGATRRMAARGAIVRSLPAVEALGSVTVLASDKTGTLTVGSTSCVGLWTPGGGEIALTGEPSPPDAAARALLVAAVLCNDAGPGAGGTEGALVAAALAAGIDVAQVRRDSPRTSEVPFDSQRREMVTRHGGTPGGTEIVKGAPEVVLARVARATDTAEVLDRWTAGARRVLAVASGAPGDLHLLGLVAMADPPRPEARAAVLDARAAGIRTIMITGDHPATATAIARATGVIDDDATVDPGAPLRPVYARTDPAGKLDIIAAWQAAGHVVAMTGDGVNDAPALRAADVGVAMGLRGTEVARSAADVVLTDDSLATVVAAVGEGRRVFDNVRRFVRYGLSGGLAEILIMLAGPFLGLPLPLLPGQILWVNLLTHGLPGVAIGSEQAEPDVLRRGPRSPREGILTRRGWVEVGVFGAAVAGSSLGVALWTAAQGRPWQTPLFAALTLGQLGIALSTRSDHRPFWMTSPRGNPFLYLAVAGSVLALLAAVYVPPLAGLLGTTLPSPSDVAAVMVAALVPAVVAEVAKAVPDRGTSADPPGTFSTAPHRGVARR